MHVTAERSEVVRTDRSLSDFMDRYERFVMGEISYDELHARPRHRFWNHWARRFGLRPRRDVGQASADPASNRIDPPQAERP